ncbi:MAG: hypothetical protein FWD15_03745 [Alphaproteobacteria bacterium]|nr:hypothetical protein [Alphaproteobacteria bacterium]
MKQHGALVIPDFSIQPLPEEQMGHIKHYLAFMGALNRFWQGYEAKFGKITNLYFNIYEQPINAKDQMAFLKPIMQIKDRAGDFVRKFFDHMITLETEYKIEELRKKWRNEDMSITHVQPADRNLPATVDSDERLQKLLRDMMRALEADFAKQDAKMKYIGTISEYPFTGNYELHDDWLLEPEDLLTIGAISLCGHREVRHSNLSIKSDYDKGDMFGFVRNLAIVSAANGIVPVRARELITKINNQKTKISLKIARTH